MSCSYIMVSDMNGLESVQHIGLHIPITVSLIPHDILSDPNRHFFKVKLKYRILPVNSHGYYNFSKQKCAATKRGWILYESGH